MKKLPKDPCGIKCFSEDDRIYFDYRYNAPGYFDISQEYFINNPVSSSDYQLYAEAFETKGGKPFGFGLGGSF